VVQLLQSSTPADSITVTFPTGFTVGAAGTIVASVGAGSGWFTSSATPPVITNGPAVLTTAPTITTSGQTVTFTLAGTDAIGASAQVLINITAGVTNPGTAGSYTVTVATSQEKNAVTSTAFAIVNPTPTPLPGVASVYNTASTPILIAQYNSLNSALVAAEGISGGATIKLSAGTYGSVTGDTVTGAYPASTNITIQGTDPSAANVIIKATGAWNIVDTGGTLVIDSVTIDGNKGNAPLTVSSSKSVTASNSNCQNGVLTIGATGTGTSNITKDTFTVKTGATGLAVTSATNVSGSTFNLTGQGGYGISAPYDVTVSGSTFTGATNTTDQYLGNGINATSADTTASPATPGSVISTSTFTGLSNALTVNNAAAIVSFNGNTVTNCGQAPASGNSTAAIIVTAASTNGVLIFGNTITNGAYYILQTGAANQQSISDNTFTGNAKSIKSTDTSNTLIAARNWWGGAANVPANVTLVSGTTAGLTFTPALGVAPGAGAFAVVGAGPTTNPIAASATVGVNVTTETGAGMIGATALSGNPVAVTIPSADTAVKYWDVYAVQADGKTAITSATVDFYGTTAAPVTTSNSAVLFYNAVNGTWVNTNASANASANAFANYMEITVASTGANITNAQFTGTPFVLVTFATTLSAITPAPTALYPANGQVNVPINNLTFTWPAVSGTGVTYQFALAQASANTSANWFAILDYSDNTTTNAEPSQEVLQPNTVYWWEVRAVTMNSSGGIAATGPWSVQMFTTAPAVTATTSSAAVTITQTNTSVIVTQPITTVQSTVTSVVITQTTGTSTQAIPSYLLWAVIAVGAILVIAVIVLIVRTRRIP
jgi:hypothetical protein